MSADDIKRQKIAEQIMAHAREHYTEGGWDVIVECWDEAEVIRVVWGYDAPSEDTPITFEAALAAVSEVVSVYDERQQDARISAGV